jgi:hypothetical protein
MQLMYKNKILHFIARNQMTYKSVDLSSISIPRIAIIIIIGYSTLPLNDQQRLAI